MKKDDEARNAFIRHARWAGQDRDDRWLRLLLKQATESGREDLHRDMRRAFAKAGGWDK